MDTNKSLDKYKLIAALLTAVFTTHGDVFNTKSRRLTLNKVKKRLDREGIGFLTKTLPRLGKAFDKALAEETPLNGTVLGFKTMPGTQLPKLFGELFSNVLQPNGTPLPNPCVNSIKSIRQLLYLFYKYELPYSDEQEQHVLAKFERTERELETIVDPRLRQLGDAVVDFVTRRPGWRTENSTSFKDQTEVTRVARRLLSSLFANFDPKDINPRHGPGAVATKQKLWRKYQWENISAKIARVYPIDEYFYSSLGHVCDRLDRFKSVSQDDLPARVILVPKDSRGPRLISCEPVDYQWIQQGLGRAIVRWVETHPLTKGSVFFTDQVPNRVGALFGSYTKRYATLDLNEASDRVSLELVRLLFPEHIYMYLESCRSSSTVMPDGMILPLHKFAPMGSCLCFPIMALCVWAILTASSPDAHIRRGSKRFGNKLCWYPNEDIHVYGDDVIVPTAQAEDAIEQLESFGLRVNRDKSCTKGFFRESCGMDAYRGVDVTPVRIRTVWSDSPSPDSYTSWIAYANAFWDKKYYAIYHYMAEILHQLYGEIPARDMQLRAPSLAWVPEELRPHKARSKFDRQRNDFQCRQFKVRVVKSRSVLKEIDGWEMLLRYFAEASHTSSTSGTYKGPDPIEDPDPFLVRSYTPRGTSMLVSRWR